MFAVKRFALVALAACWLAALAVPAPVHAADDRFKTIDDLRRAIATLDAEIAEYVRTGQAAARDAQTRYTALSGHLAQMKPLVDEETELLGRLREAELWEYLHALPQQIRTELPPLRERLASVQRTLKNQADRWRMLGVSGERVIDPNRAFLQYCEAVLDAEVKRLERMQAILTRELPNLKPPAWVQRGQSVAEAKREQVTALGMLRQGLTPLREQEATLRTALTETRRMVNHLIASLEEKRHERLRLLHLLATDFDPVWLKQVRIIAPKERRAGKTVYYEASFTEPAQIEALNKEIAFLIESLVPVQKALVERRDAFEEAEKRFIDVSNRWQVAHRRAMELQDHAYYWAIGLELADATIGILADGGTPATIFFEAAWRAGEAGLKDFRIDEPPVAQHLTDYRARLAKQLTPTGPSQMTGKVSPDFDESMKNLDRMRREMAETAAWFNSLGARTKAHVQGEQMGELFKGTSGTVSTGAFRSFAKWALEKGGRPEDVVDLIDKRIFDPRFEIGELVRSGVNRINNWRPLPERLMNIVRRGDAASSAVQQADSAMKDFGKGVALGAAVTGAKEVIISWNQNERARVAAQKALLDIEWLLRRHEYQQRNAIYRAFAKRASELESAIGHAMEEKGKLQVQRTLTVKNNSTFATADSMRVHLTFNHPVEFVMIHAGERSFSNAFENKAEGTVDIPAWALTAGDVTLGVEARSTRFGREIPVDSDPKTIARFDPAADLSQPYTRIFQAYEGGRDQTHTVTVAKPIITIVNKKENGYLVGDWIDFEYTLPGSLAGRNVKVTATPMQEPVETDLPVGEKGSGQFQVPPRAGSFDLLLFNTGETNRLADESFDVVLTLLKAAGSSTYVKTYLAPLADRGNRMAEPTAPIPAGKGRLTLATRDAAQQLVGPRVSIRPPGGDEELAYTWGNRTIDLEPGAYDVYFAYPIEMVARNVAVTEGQVHILHTRNLGRATFDTRDALGEPNTSRISIRYAGQDQEVVYTWGQRSIELPPGKYDIVIAAVPPIEHAGLIVEQGHDTLVRSGGYARLQVDALDAQRQPITPRVSIRQAGSEKELAYTWAGRTIDLPPDKYDLVFAAVAEPTYRDIALTAGEVTRQLFSGYGRLDVKALDGARQPITPRVSIRQAGSEEEYAYTWAGRTIDVPPGKYTLVFGYALGLTFRDIEVNREQVTPVTAGNVGRLRLHASGGSRRLSIRRAGSEDEIASVFTDSYIDLPPGAYTGVYDVGDDRLTFSFSISPYTETSMTLR